MQEMTMPLAIVMPEIGNIPSVIYHDEAIDSLKQFRTFSEASELKDIQAAQYWLALMPDPSGWYDDHSVAKTVVNNMKKTGDATIEEIKTRENVLGLSQSRFVHALGVGGNDNTVQKLCTLVAEDELEKLEKS